MNLSESNIAALKQMAKINSQVWFPSGKTAKVGIVDNEKTCAGFWELDLDIQNAFGVYDLNELLGILALYKEPTVTEGETELTISGKGVSYTTKYRYTAKDCIVSPPEDSKFVDLMSSVKDVVNLPAATVAAIKEHSTILKAPHVILDGDTIVAMDDDNPSSNSVTFDVEGANFPRTVLLRENFIKLIEGDYEIRTDGKRTELKHGSGKIVYYTSRVQTAAKKEAPKAA